LPRLLMLAVSEAASAAALEQATSCMYSLAREHTESKLSLVKVGALRALCALLSHESKQCQLNSCATLYAVSCAGRETCKALAAFEPLHRLVVLVNPGLGRTAQDDQLQLFAALLIVNLLHVKGVSKDGRSELLSSLQRAFDETSEAQVRETIAVGLKRLEKMGSRKARLKQGVKGGLSAARKSISTISTKGITGGSSHTVPGQAGPTRMSGMQGFGPDGNGAAPSGGSSSGGTARRLSASVAKGVGTGVVLGVGAVKGGLSMASKAAAAARRRGNSSYKGSDSADWEE
jgi:hypothetical protein